VTDDLAAQILASVNSMRGELTRHMEEEGTEIQSLKDELQEWRFAAEKRHSELMKSLDSWTNKMDFSDAFVKDAHGNPLLAEHCDEHLSSKEFRTEVADIKRHVRKIGVTGAVMGFFTWAGYILWAAFIKGPQ
jgi:hypothetical protein